MLKYFRQNYFRASYFAANVGGIPQADAETASRRFISNVGTLMGMGGM